MENKLILQTNSSLGFFGIIKESFKTTRRNVKLLVPILLLMFLSYSLLDFALEYTIGPIANDFMLQLANNPNMVHDLVYNINQTSSVGAFNVVREIVLVTLLVSAISSIITLVFLVATVTSSYEAYTSKALGPKDIFLKIGKSLKRPIVTSFHLILLSFGITSFYTILIGITAFLAVNSWALLVLLGVTALSIPICYCYVATLWMVSLIVSVLEEGSSGLKAIGRASELMKGKRLKALLMMVLFTLADVLVILVANVFSSYYSTLSAKFAMTIPFRNGVECLLSLSMFVVYTVFYHEWKSSHDEKEGKGIYLPIVNGEA